jgi:uncharacterized protein YbjT (DUF2867 family)
MTMDKKIAVVFGATGQQGGSVARALLQSGQFQVRVITRSINSEASKALQAQGADAVRADLDSIDDLHSVLEVRLDDPYVDLD